MQIYIYIAVIVAILALTIFIASITRKNKKLDKTSEVLFQFLPHLDCGECGRSECRKFAEDLAKGKTAANRCPYLRGKDFMKVRQIMKRERKVQFDMVAFVKCKGGIDCNEKYEYIGDKSCASQNLIHDGCKFCQFACLGCGDCVKACKYDAISISKKGCAIIDKDKCVGCRECVYACPNKLIDLIPYSKYVEVVCNNSSTDSAVTRNCKVSCTHCEACVVACPSGAISMVGGLPKIDHTKCVRCGKCVAACPEHVISRI
ncbi:MAG: 4Fe-4S binding protein [Clostridia bacterium]|nr:4Fe-4S binding protein [Clostridia bacterium]